MSQRATFQTGVGVSKLSFSMEAVNRWFKMLFLIYTLGCNYSYKKKQKNIKSKDMEHLLLLYNDKHVCVFLHAVYMWRRNIHETGFHPSGNAGFPPVPCGSNRKARSRRCDSVVSLINSYSHTGMTDSPFVCLSTEVWHPPTTPSLLSLTNWPITAVAALKWDFFFSLFFFFFLFLETKKTK